MKNIPIILKNADRFYQYLVKISDGIIYNKEYKYTKSEESVCFSTSGLECFENNVNLYSNFEGEEELSISAPSRMIRLCFPEYNAGKNVYYIATFKTWISGKNESSGQAYEIILGQYLIRPENRLAMPHEIYKTFRYIEYADLWIPDPWAIMYDDIWSEWRNVICEESADSGSPLVIEIHPVELGNNGWMISHVSDPGYSDVILNRPNDYLTVDLSMTENSGFEMDLKYNSAYNNLKEYLEETYQMTFTDLKLRWEIVIKDEDILYYANEYIDDEYEETPEHETKIFAKSEFGIENWDQYIDGLFIIGSVDIIDGDSVKMTILSNSIPLIPDIYKFLIRTDIDSIKINEVNMNNYNVDVVNKIEKTVIQVDNAKDYKNNIIKPVFFQTHPIGNIIIHPQVTENISINLDSYKSKTSFFYIRVEGVDFSEIGRTSTGIIFKIQGSLLPGEVKNGLIYILDSNKEMITTGNYQYVE